jgi:hypothetical protein
LICNPDAVFEPFLEAGGLKVGFSRPCVLPYGDVVNASIRCSSRHLKQFVANDSEDVQPGVEIYRSVAAALRLLRSLEVGIGSRTQPVFFRDFTDNISTSDGDAGERIGVCLLFGEDLLAPTPRYAQATNRAQVPSCHLAPKREM